jgi:hypothetical protein
LRNNARNCCTSLARNYAPTNERLINKKARAHTTTTLEALDEPFHDRERCAARP